MISATSAPLGGTSAATNVTSQKNAATCGMTFATEITKTLIATRATFAKTGAMFGVTARTCATIGKRFAATVGIYGLIGGTFALIAGSNGWRQIRFARGSARLNR